MKKFLALALVVSSFAVLVGGANATHSWSSYHWARTANPFTLKLGDNVSLNWDPILVTSSADWSTPTGSPLAPKVLDTTIVQGQAGSVKRCNATAGRVEVCNGSYGNNGWLGIASIWASGSHITQGTVKLNDSYFNTTKYNTPAWRNLVMCQEVGHTFGLGHQDENFSNANLGTCMDYTNDPSTNQHPNTHDYDQLATIYSHFDSSTTIQSSTSSLPGNAKPFSQASRANGSVYVDHLPGGVTLLTHVFWTP